MTDDDQTKLNEARAAIDAIDGEIVTWLNRRFERVAEVGHIKRAAAGPDRGFYRPDREAEVLNRLLAKNTGPMGSEALLAIFREIISQSLSLEARQTVAYLGPAGTFSEQAAVRHFGSAPDYYPAPSFDEVFRAIDHGTADWAVVPVENSTEGAVSRVLDCLMETPFRICAEITLPIHQDLLCLTTDLSKVSTVYSHQQSLSQCRHWLDAKLPGAVRVAVASNGEAARLAANDPTACAIAGAIARKPHPTLKSCYCHIEDEPDNTTRFVVLGRPLATRPTGRDKTSLLLGLENRAGSMFELIEPIADRKISMSRIESRPAKRGLKNSIWEYVFFVDLEGHAEDDAIASALEELKRRAGFVKVLGSYPRAVG